MQNNIGTVDRYVRLTAGLLALGAGVSMRRQSVGRTLLMSLGAMKVAEGVTGWCPLVQLAQSAASQTGTTADQKTGGASQSASITQNPGQSNKGAEASSASSGRSANEQRVNQTSRRVRAVRKTAGPRQAAHTHDGRTHQSTPMQ